LVESLAAFLAVLAILWALLWLKFRGSTGRVKVYPLLLIVRSGIKGEPLSGLPSRVLSGVGWFSVAVLLVAMAAFYYLAVTLFIRRYIAPPEGGGFTEGFVPLLPGVTIPLEELPLLLIPIGVAVLFHEVAHALVARATGVRVKDAGFILLAFIPGAFVEPDESELRRAPLTSRLKIYSAGVTANVILALLALGALTLLAPTLYHGVLVLEVDRDMPAGIGGLEGGMVIVEVNGLRVKSVEDFMRVLEELGVKDRGRAVTLEVKVLHDGREVTLNIVKPEGLDKLGVRVSQSFSWGFIAMTIWLLFLINVALALINAAPIVIPTPAGAIASDGAHFLGDVVARLLGEKAKYYIAPVIGLATLLLVVSLITLTPIDLIP
jgi:membrane-associated protease RseP (regulator of RpoE activity)